jgi:Mrp family chromosome partitioning ATPase
MLPAGRAPLDSAFAPGILIGLGTASSRSGKFFGGGAPGAHGFPNGVAVTGVYEALQRARQGDNEHPLPADWQERAPGQLQAARTPGPIAVELTPLLSAMRPLLDGNRGAVLHFVAAAPGEGTSTIAREFALLAATTGRRRALLIDAARGDPQTACHFGCDTSRGLVDGIWIGFDEADLRYQVPGTLLSVACLVGDRSNGPADAVTLSSLYEQLRDQFELVIVDCAAMMRGEYSTLLPDEADGIFLVIQAEHTRPAVIAHAKTLVEQAGGNFLGAVLNRRRNYIPDFLYRLL